MSQQPHLEAESMLDVYIHDYLVKRKLHVSSQTFQAEARVPTNVTAIDAPCGFLFEWWTIFWDTFIDRYKCQNPARKDPLNTTATKQKIRNNRGPCFDPTSSVSLPLIKHQKQVSLPTQDMRGSMSQLVMGAAGSNRSLIGVNGSSRSVNSLPLKGWPLMGLDQLPPALLQQQQSLMQSPQLSSYQLQLQRQLLLQAHRNIAAPSPLNDLGSREFEVLGNWNTSTGKGHQFKSVDPKDPNDGFKNQTERKRKQPTPSAGPTSSSGAANTTGPSPSSAPSTPSTTHTTGDIVSMPTLPETDGASNPSYMTSAANQLVHMDHYVDDGSLDDNIDSLLSHSVADAVVDVGRGFTFSEIGSIHANSTDCCHFSSDGKLLVSGGHDNKAKIWCADSQEYKFTLDEHSDAITDARFSPTAPLLATSSIDKTVRVWDVENSCYSFRTFIGHHAPVMSLDFHPNKDDLVCSSDDSSEIRFWSIKKSSCVRIVAKGGAKQVRFQPNLGRYLAAAVGSTVSIIDSETTQTSRSLLKGHKSKVQSVCWDFSGEHLASVSDDLVRVWRIGAGGEQECVHELSVTGKKFCCCSFHPHYSSLLIIGCDQSLELWNMAENKMMSPLKEPIAALAVSEISGLVASAGHNNLVKLWKCV